jgi:hypothetical protein
MKVLLLLCVSVLVALSGCTSEFPTANLDEPVLDNGVLAKKPVSALNCTIDYVLARHLGIFDSEGRILAWDGTIHGDLEGRVLWWFVPGGGPPSMPDAARVGFYEARWEIWNGDDLLLAGESSGSTALPPNKDGIWRGNGVVTEAGAGYEAWLDRPTKEGGSVVRIN